MRSYITSHLIIALHAIVIALVFIGSAWYIDRTFSQLELTLTAQVTESVEKLSEIATITDRNGADALTEQIIIDCPRRTEFENALNALGTATKKELMEAQQLFESCGSFYAERKAFMVAELEREYAVLQNKLSLIASIRDLTAEELKLSKWEALIDLERTRSNYLAEQTSIQSTIITLLIEGGAGARINDLVKQAQNIAQSLTVTDTQIDEVRLTLL